MEDGYVINKKDIEAITDILSSRKPNEDGFYAWFNCVERGVVNMDLTEFVPCNNDKCENCTSYNKLFKETIK
jgi:hypothetical protein